MEQAVKQITDFSARLASLKERLAQLDAERAEVTREIRNCVMALSSATSTHLVGSAAAVTTRARVLAVFHADPTAKLTTADLNPLVGNEIPGTLRAILRRMVNDGLLVRLRRGLYALRQH